ncbi:GNAT family N-acetyltransferase [Anaerosalibacter bizertensis]|uniref:GNAT family N-acetyltransferase n=1 Tax=Anaerosalibacter bizertensis TaxID=932217 RepID=UPI0035136D05
MRKDIEDVATFYELQWDTEYFGVKSAKAILGKPLTIEQWNELESLFRDYQFVSIENCNSDPINAQIIGKNTNAFLADVNIQFSKSLKSGFEKPSNVNIYQKLEKNKQVLEMTDFKYSKFIEDPELAKRGGEQVYYHWILNSFNKNDKLFALSKDINGNVDGFLLHSYTDKACIVELIAVSKKAKGNGIGTRLFKAVEYSTFQRGFRKINVGTQVRNIGAINFYHRVGCKQIGCHQVYHLWNL